MNQAYHNPNAMNQMGGYGGMNRNMCGNMNQMKMNGLGGNMNMPGYRGGSGGAPGNWGPQGMGWQGMGGGGMGRGGMPMRSGSAMMPMGGRPAGGVTIAGNVPTMAGNMSQRGNMGGGGGGGGYGGGMMGQRFGGYGMGGGYGGGMNRGRSWEM